MNFRGKVVVVTGASAGLGRAIAIEFAKQGADIALLARGQDGLNAAARQIRAMGRQALIISVDVANSEEVENAAAQVNAKFGKIDIWVNNAMTSVFARADEITPDEYKRVTDVTYLGYVYGTLAALRYMKACGKGSIVQVGSAVARRAIPLQAAYSGAKHAIKGFTESVRTELMHDRLDKINISLVQMPALNTPQFRWVLSKLPNLSQPVPPIYQPEVGARAVVWVAQHPRKEFWVGSSTYKAIIGQELTPEIADLYLARNGFSAQQLDEPDDHKAPNNLWKPVPGDAGVHGVFDDRAKSYSVTTWLKQHQRSVLLGLGSAIAMAFLVRSSSRTSAND